MVIKLKNFLIFNLLIISLMISIKSEISKLSASVSSVILSHEITFKWENVDENDIDAKIIFWYTDSYPSENYHKIENSWKFLNEQSKYNKSHPEKSGVITMKSPNRKGLYSIYYCAENIDGFYCNYQRQITVIECLKDRPSSNIEHLIVIISENHSFDSIYGNYCKAAPFSNPICNNGPECCEGIPANLNGVNPKILTDIQNGRYDPCHSNDCEASEMNGGKMDKYIIGGVGSNPNNYAAAVDDLFSAKFYFGWAKNYAIADRFFQSSSGASSQNDMYFATGKFMFRDNAYAPQSKKIPGASCRSENDMISFYDPTVADLLNTCGINWTFYGQGYNEKMTSNDCPDKFFDATDDPFAYFPSLTDSVNGKQSFRDLSDLMTDLVTNSDSFPSVSYVKFLEAYSEHPGASGSLLAGQLQTNKIIEALMNSKFANNTLIVLVPDESGGFYDHVTPPPASTIDGMQYGPRTPFVLVGDMVKKNFVSHIPLESSSIIRFIEWNWIGEEGQLNTRDRIANNIGDLLDSKKTGISVPSINKSEIKSELKLLENDDVSKIKDLNFGVDNLNIKFLDLIN